MCFDLPALMRAVDELKGRGSAGSEPGGGQAGDRFWLPQPLIGEARVDYIVYTAVVFLPDG